MPARGPTHHDSSDAERKVAMAPLENDAPRAAPGADKDAWVAEMNARLDEIGNALVELTTVVARLRDKQPSP